MQFHTLHPLDDQTEINCKLKKCSRTFSRTHVEERLLEDHRELYKKDLHVLIYLCELKKSVVKPDNWQRIGNKFPRPKLVHGVNRYYWYTWTKDEGKTIYSRWKPFSGSLSELSGSLIWEIGGKGIVKKNK